MTLTQLVMAAWVKSQGELPTFQPGSDDWNYVLNLANYYIDQWANEPGIDWYSLYDPAYALGNITNTNTYDIDPDDVRKISQELGDSIRVAWTDGIHFTDYDLVSADELKQHTETVCAQIGDTLVFNRTFIVSDAEFGGALTIPVYAYPAKLVKERDIVPVDRPNWLVASVAYDIALHDILRKDTSGNLSAEANSIMERMRQDNEGQLNLVGLPTNITVDW